MGTIRVWHFKHKSKSSCPGGGESELHYKMKYWFYSQAKKHGFRVDIEEMIYADIPHKPDVIIYLNEDDATKYHCKGVALECARASYLRGKYFY